MACPPKSHVFRSGDFRKWLDQQGTVLIRGDLVTHCAIRRWGLVIQPGHCGGGMWNSGSLSESTPHSLLLWLP